MKRPVLTSKRVKIGAVVLAIALALIFALPAVATGWFADVFTGDATPGPGFELSTHE